MLDHNYLLENFSYSPSSGEFKRLKSRLNQKVGSIKDGYLVIKIGGVKHYAHRLAVFYMTKYWPSSHIDHINHVRSDNRWENLRVVSQLENNKNKSIYANNNSGVSGVSFCNTAGMWRARIGVNGARVFLGYFKDLQSAESKVREARVKYRYHANHSFAPANPSSSQVFSSR